MRLERIGLTATSRLKGRVTCVEDMRVSDATEPIERAIDRIVAVYRDAGLAPIRPAAPGIEQVLAEIQREITPLRLPYAVERFWQLVDPSTVTVGPYPDLTSAEFALESWQSHRDEFPGMTPKILFPIAYQSHDFLFVELEDEAALGGAVLEWGYAGSPFYVRFASLAGHLDLLATMIELGEFTRHEQASHGWVEFDPDGRWEDAQAVRLASSQPLPRLGMARELDEDVREWPEHWLAADGLTAEVRSPRGATTTVAELLRAAHAGETTSGTIRGTVTRLGGSAAGCRISVDDGTGLLDVWCPAAVTTYGPVIRRTFEFDVVVRPDPDAAPDWTIDQQEVQRRALSHDMEGAQSAVMGLYARMFDTSAAAEATAVRPLD